MADQKISGLTQHTASPAAADEFVMVDKSDTTMAASGTDKRITWSSISGGSAKPSDYGAVGIGVGDTLGGITNGQFTLTISGGTNDFVQGQRILVRGAGTFPANPADSVHPDLTATISTVAGSTLTLDTAAGATVVGAKVFHDDTPAIQAALNASNHVFLAPIPGGYGVNAQWFGDLCALRMPSGRTLQGSGYPGRLVRLDTYRWGNLGTFRLIVDAAIPARNGTVSNGTNVITGLSSTSDLTTGMGIQNANFPGTGIPIGTRIASIDSPTQITVTKASTNSSTFSIGFQGNNFSFKDLYIDGRVQEVLDAWPQTTTVGATNIASPPGSITLTSVAGWPTSGSVTARRADNTWVHAKYNGITGTTLNNIVGFSHDTSNTIPSGAPIEPDVAAQQYQCILFDGARASKIYGFWMDNCTINGWPGTTIRPKNVENFRIADCNLINVNRGPLEITDSCAWGMVSNNVVDGAFDDGLDMNGNIQTENNGEEAHHIDFIGNIVRQQNSTYKGRTGNTCIKIAGGQHINVIGNILEGGENTAAILAWDSDSSTGVPAAYAALTNVNITGNVCRGSSVHGIRVRSFEGENIKVHNNIIDSPYQCGIMIEPKTPDETPGRITDITVTDNEIYDPGIDPRTDTAHGGLSDSVTGIFRNGIRFDGTACIADRLTCTGNRIVRARTEAINSQIDGQDFQIDDNQIYGANWNNLVSTTDSISLNSGTVKRFTVRDNHFVNAPDSIRVDVVTPGSAVAPLANEVQRITLPTGIIDSTPTGSSTWTLTVDPGGGGQQTTGPIQWNATAANVQTALQATTYGSGNITVAGATGGPYTVTFASALSNTDVTLMAANNTNLVVPRPRYAINVANTWSEGTIGRNVMNWKHFTDGSSAMINDNSISTNRISAPPKIVRVVGDQTPIVSNTLVDAAGLVFNVDGSDDDDYFVEAYLRITATTTAMDVKFGWTFPTGTTMQWGALNHADPVIPGFGPAELTATAPALVLNQNQTLAIGSNTGTFFASLGAYVFGGTTAGPVQLRIAQNTTDAVNALTVKSSCFLRINQIAP